MTQLVEKRPVYIAFIDYTKAFDKVKGDKLWEIMHERGVPQHLLRATQSLYKETEIQIESGGKKSKTVMINQGVSQGCHLSPTLFN